LHEVSARRRGRFVAMNCAAIPETLFESELFGHERGAFTGATMRRAGRVELASGGTLFLDEIGEMPLLSQAKLLRVLQEREFERVGGGETIKADVRIVAATSVDLEEAVRRKRFREDLLYRLNVVPIHLPPLRGRREDIPLLAAHFIEVYAQQMGKHGITLSRGALQKLEAFDWPGNVRQLANTMERAVLLTRSGGCIPASELGILNGASLAPPSWESTAASTDASAASSMSVVGLKDAVERLEREMILGALRESGGNQTQAAKQLGITRQGLAQKMAKYGMRADDDSTR
jgi:transcriptional regulator with GAF, ATPase, and Fis domain